MSAALLPSGQSPSLQIQPPKPNQVGTVMLYGVPIVSLMMENVERLCLAQISNTLLKGFSYNEIHNRRVALGITCVQCTPVQLEMLRRAGAMPVSSRRCGMITRREAERLCKSFLGDNTPPRLPEDFAFAVHHECAWGCRGAFIPARYNSSRAKCIKCSVCGLFFSPNKFIFHSHRSGPASKYVQPDAANFNSWRRHMRLSGSPPEEVVHAWEDVKAMFNGGTRKRLLGSGKHHHTPSAPKPKRESSPPNRVPPLPLVMDYVWKHPFPAYPLPWLPPAPLLLPPHDRKTYPSAFTPVYSALPPSQKDSDSEETVDIETCPEDDVKPAWSPHQKTETLPKPGSQSDVEIPNKAEGESGGSGLWVPQLPLDCSRPAESFYRQQVVRHLHMMRELVSPAEATTGFRPVARSPERSPIPEMLSPVEPGFRPVARSPERPIIPEKPRSGEMSPIDCSTCHQIGAYSNILPLAVRTHDHSNSQ